MKFQIRQKCHETNSSSMHSLVRTRKNKGVRMTQEEIRDEFYLNEPWYKERHKNDEKEVVELYQRYENEYGRSPFAVLYTFREKLNYALAEYCGNNYSIDSYLKAEEYFINVFKPLITRLVGCDDVELDMDYRGFIIYSDTNTEFFDEVEEVPYKKLVHVDTENRNDLDNLVEGCYKNIDINGRPIEEAYFYVPDFGSIDHQSCGVLTRFLKRNNLTLEDYLVRKDIVVIIDGDEYCVLSSLIECGLIDKNNIININNITDIEECED